MSRRQRHRGPTDQNNGTAFGLGSDAGAGQAGLASYEPSLAADVPILEVQNEPILARLASHSEESWYVVQPLDVGQACLGCGFGDVRHLVARKSGWVAESGSYNAAVHRI
jgi:hypothetical protein